MRRSRSQCSSMQFYGGSFARSCGSRSSSQMDSIGCLQTCESCRVSVLAEVKSGVPQWKQRRSDLCDFLRDLFHYHYTRNYL